MKSQTFEQYKQRGEVDSEKSENTLFSLKNSWKKGVFTLKMIFRMIWNDLIAIMIWSFLDQLIGEHDLIAIIFKIVIADHKKSDLPIPCQED